MVLNVTQVPPLNEDIINEDDVPHLSPIRVPLLIYILGNEIRWLSDGFVSLEERYWRFRVVTEELFSEVLACLQPMEDATWVAMLEGDREMVLFNLAHKKKWWSVYALENASLLY